MLVTSASSSTSQLPAQGITHAWRNHNTPTLPRRADASVCKEKLENERPQNFKTLRRSQKSSFLLSTPDFHPSAGKTDFAPIVRVDSPTQASAPAHSPQTKLYFFNLKKKKTCKVQMGVFHWDGGSAAPPRTIHPSLPAAGSLQNTPKAFYSGRKGGACLGSLQSIVKRQIIDNYPQKSIREAEADTRHQSHPSWAPAQAASQIHRWDTVCKRRVTSEATPTLKITF